VVNAPDDILALIERLEADLAALKRAVQPDDDDDDELRNLARERAARLKAKGGAR
jgi:hypothetical protein